MLATTGSLLQPLYSQSPDEETPPELAKASYPTTEAEALGRARWLHEAIHGSLQVMHRDFFGDGDEDIGLSLPSQSLEDVFKEMSRSWSVEIRWLGVNATHNDDHLPINRFEEEAVEAFLEGKTEYSKTQDNQLRYAGAITLHNQCLKCHVPNRASMENRLAALSITMPLRSAED